MSIGYYKKITICEERSDEAISDTVPIEIKLSKIAVGILLCAFVSVLSAQTDTSSVFVMPEMKISQKEKTEQVTYKFEGDRNIFLVTDSFLVANPDKYNYKVNLFDLKKISVRNETYVWKTAGIGAAVGFVLGMVFGIALKYGGGEGGGHPNISFHDMPFTAILALGSIGAISFAVIGASIGAAITYFENYNILGSSHDKRKLELIKVLKRYRMKR
jgi:hypothetical protein